MKHQKWILVLSLITVFFGVSCSNQYRISSTDQGSFILDQLDQTAASASSTEMNRFLQLAKTPGAAVYYSDSEVYGPVLSTASLASFAFIDRSDLWYGNIDYIQLFYVDLLTTEGSETAMMISFRESGSETLQTKILFGTRKAVIDNGEYVAVLGVGDQEKLVLRTRYLNDAEDLEPVLRMDVFDFDAAGIESYVGQFSTMVGYQL